MSKRVERGRHEERIVNENYRNHKANEESEINAVRQGSGLRENVVISETDAEHQTKKTPTVGKIFPIYEINITSITEKSFRHIVYYRRVI